VVPTRRTVLVRSCSPTSAPSFSSIRRAVGCCTHPGAPPARLAWPGLVVLSIDRSMVRIFVGSREDRLQGARLSGHRRCRTTTTAAAPLLRQEPTGRLLNDNWGVGRKGRVSLLLLQHFAFVSMKVGLHQCDGRRPSRFLSHSCSYCGGHCWRNTVPQFTVGKILPSSAGTPTN
jgi:hypothetical protein